MKLERILNLTTSGDDVKWIQEKLAELGFFKGKIDGYFGQDTLSAVANFQRKGGDKVTGVINLRVWSQISNAKRKPVVRKTQKRIKSPGEIPYNILYSNEFGLKIYNNQISSDLYYEEETKKTTIWIKNTENGYKPNGLWEVALKRNSSGEIETDDSGNTMSLKSSQMYTICGLSKSDKNYNGKIIRNFDGKYWSYHSPFLKIAKKMQTNSISIEICNYGPLIKKGNSFYSKSGILVENDQVIEIDFRGYKYWHKYTKEQLEALESLLSYLIEKWDIKVLSEFNIDSLEYNKSHNSEGGIKTISQFSVERLGINPQSEIIEIIKNCCL